MPRLTVKQCAQHMHTFLTRPVKFHCPPMHELTHKGEHFFHCSYLLLVGVESHYWYGKVALGLLGVIVVGMFTKDHEAMTEHAETHAVEEMVG